MAPVLSASVRVMLARGVVGPRIDSEEAAVMAGKGWTWTWQRCGRYKYHKVTPPTLTTWFPARRVGAAGAFG